MAHRWKKNSKKPLISLSAYLNELVQLVQNAPTFLGPDSQMLLFLLWVTKQKIYTMKALQTRLLKKGDIYVQEKITYIRLIH